MDDIRHAGILVRVRITGKVIKVLDCTRKYLHHLRTICESLFVRTRKMHPVCLKSTHNLMKRWLTRWVLWYIYGCLANRKLNRCKTFHIVTTSDRLNYSANIVFCTNFMHFHSKLFYFPSSLCRLDASMRCSGIRQANPVKDNKRWNARSPTHHHISFYRNP